MMVGEGQWRNLPVAALQVTHWPVAACACVDRVRERVAARCVDLWVEALNSQASTLASPWHVAYGFKNRLALREIFSRQTAWMLTNSSPPEACDRLSRGSKPFGPVTPARPPSRPGRSASAAAIIRRL
eukprot:scaffold34272_cov61-Phaeocystis_antarctica.AAC.2